MKSDIMERFQNWSRNLPAIPSDSLTIVHTLRMYKCMNIMSINLSKTVKIVMDRVPDTVSLKELSTMKKKVFKAS